MQFLKYGQFLLNISKELKMEPTGSPIFTVIQIYQSKKDSLMIMKLCKGVTVFRFRGYTCDSYNFLFTTILGVYILSRVFKEKQKQQLKQLPQKLNNPEEFSINYSLITNNQWGWG